MFLSFSVFGSSFARLHCSSFSSAFYFLDFSRSLAETSRLQSILYHCQPATHICMLARLESNETSLIHSFEHEGSVYKEKG